MRLDRPIVLTVVVLVCLCSVSAGPARGAGVPEAALWATTAEGEPGQEAAVEFRATIERPLRDFSILFEGAEEAAAFVRTDVEGTAASHVAPRGIVYDPTFFRGGYRTGCRMNAQGQCSQVEPGENIILCKAVFRIHPDAAAGDYPVTISRAEFTAVPIASMPVKVQGQGLLRVLPPTGPRPVSGLQCVQSGSDVVLSWTATETYDEVLVTREGLELARLSGSETTFKDRPEIGPVSYEVMAAREGKLSVPAPCTLLVQAPRPPAVTGLSCLPSGSVVQLSWTNGAAYDSIQVLRNGRLLEDLAGASTAYSDAWASDLFTVYTLKALAGGVEALPVSCTLNEMSDVYPLWAEEVRAAPGSAGVRVRFFVTNPEPLQGIEVALRVDPALARIRELTLEGTVSDAAQYDFFDYQPFFPETGETAAGIAFDIVPPYGFCFPAGAEQHCMTLIVDLLPETPSGTIIPVQLGTREVLFGDPLQFCGLTVNKGKHQDALISDGAILVGSSPVPEVRGARAEFQPAAGTLGAPGRKAETGVGVALEWENGASYSGIRIERDGKPLGEISGDLTGYFDASPGPGAHRYSIVSVKGALESFPVTVAVRPEGVPGTFFRGDASSDARINVSDAVLLASYLFASGPEPYCLDAADADDDGFLGLADAVGILLYLFSGAGPLPPPGPDFAWFDPTPDGLTCR